MVIWLIVFLVLFIEISRLTFEIQKNKKADAVRFKRQKELKYLNLVTNTPLAKNEPIEQYFPELLNLLKQELGWTYHSIFRLDEDKQLLTIRFTGYLPSWYMQELSTKLLIKVGDASVGRAVSTKQPVTINTANSDPRFKNITPLAGQTGYNSLSCYPMIGRLKTHGGFCTYSAYENIFTLHDTQFFLTCANFFAAILEKKLLEKALPSKIH